MEKRKKDIIGLIIVGVCVLWMIIAFFSRFGSSANADKMLMMCSDDKCKHCFTITREEYNDFLGKNLMPGQAINCPKCGKRTAYFAVKCAKCGNVFYPVYQPEQPYDKCPECGYSETDDRSKSEDR